MELKLYEIVLLEQAIDEIIMYDLSFDFNTSLTLMKNKKYCKEITDLCFKRLSIIFKDEKKIIDISLLTEEELPIYNQIMNSIVFIPIIQIPIKNFTFDDDVKFKLSLFNDMKCMLLDE